MKKLSIAAFFSLLLIGFGCKKEKPKSTQKLHQKNFISNLAKTAQEEETYFDDMIKTVTYGIADLSANPIFRQVVAEQVALQFDYDDNVLLLNLDSALMPYNINLEQEMINCLNAHGKQNLVQNVFHTIHGFQYFGDTIYTQLYIPFIEGKDLVSSVPTICMNFNDDLILSSLKVEGSTLVEGVADEAFAMNNNNNVYVVSVNENTNGDGKSKLKRSATGSTLKTAKQGDRLLFVDDINISEKKEAWGNGRSDISFIAIITKFGCNRQTPDKVGIPFCKLADRDLNKWFSATHGNKNIADGNPDFWEQTDFEDMAVIFYEHDLRKKFGRTFAPSYCPYTVASYTSKESEYGVVVPNIFDYGSSTTYTSHTLSGGEFKLKGWGKLW
jgi:hypothetical protein